MVMHGQAAAQSSGAAYSVGWPSARDSGCLQLLANEDIRLVTLTGPGGTGKTRLGLEVAARRQDQVGDVAAFVDLAPLDDPRLLIPTVAECLGIRDTGRRPLLEVLTGHLRDKHLLLLLDNFEQIVSPRRGRLACSRACPS